MDVNQKKRRRHDAEFKERVLLACAEPGASVAQSFGLNDNLVHQWRRGRGASLPSTTPMMATEAIPGFVSPMLPAPGATPQPLPSTLAAPETIHVEIKRGALAVEVDWPISAAAQCGSWMRELLR